jgi:teichuronic acid biosynthesis glycosyltransferase TuaC
MKILVLTTLYPNAIKPHHGIFVEQRLRQLLAATHIQANVIAPVPWFPFRHPVFGRYADFAKVPTTEQRYGITVSHPRYVVLPKFGMVLAPWLLVLALYPLLRRKLNCGDDFDIIDAHYAYPDGVAAVMLGKLLKKPVVITARGSDINLLSTFYWPRQMLIWAAQRADTLITVCQDLKDKIVALGVAKDHIHVLRNGVDLNLFTPQQRAIAQQQLQLQGPTLLSVGHLVQLKGHHLVIEALVNLPAYQLLIAGGGEELPRLQKLARDLGVADRVRFLGVLSHAQLVTVYSAADILVLASSREGWPNVLLEAMACGTPVIATEVSGTPEVITAPAAGLLMKERSANAIVQAVLTLQQNPPARLQTRQYAEGYSWDATVRGMVEVFQHVCGKRLG